MPGQFIKRPRSLTPRVAVIGVLIFVIAAAGAALLLTRGGSRVEAGALQPYAARIDRLDGSVGVARVEGDPNQLEWAEATINTPVAVGDRVYARQGAHTSVALTGHNFVRLNSDTACDFLTLEEQRTQIALRSGSALFDVGALAQDGLYEVATPYGAVDFREPGLYQVGIDDNTAIISVLSGLAEVVGLGGSGQINKGEVFTLAAAAAAEALTSHLTPNLAGGIVDDYYRYRYPKVYDGRYRNYDTYLEDPFYYDPYRTSASYQYLRSDVAGLYDLDDYGDWEDVNDYGHCWAPRVSAGWAPYRSGRWDLDELWGPSWVSSEPWGWAPYHYGRWAFVNQRWFWVPSEVRTRAEYCPAAVAFIPIEDQIAWVPLGPGEAYVPRYYDTNWRPRYLASAEVINVVTVQRTFVNYNAPGAVTVIPLRSFNRVIDPRMITPFDQALVARSRPVLDPFSVDGVRELAIGRDDGRRRFRLERREQEALNRAVVTRSTPELFAVRRDAAKALGIEALPDKAKKNKLRIEQGPGAVAIQRPDGLPQQGAGSQRMKELASRAEQGDRSARREMRQLLREEQRGAAAQQQAQQQTQQEQSRQQLKEQRKAERQQQAAAASQQEAARQAQQQQLKQQRKAERQQQTAAAAQQAEQQGAARRAQRQQVRQQQQQQTQQQEQSRQQRKAEKQAAAAQSQRQAAQQAQQQGAARQAQRQQVRQQQQQQEQVRQQQKQQQKQQKRERKPPEAVVQQQSRQAEQTRMMRAQREAASQSIMAQQREQAKAQKRAERQGMMQQQAVRAQAAESQAMTAQREQMKAQKRAERQASAQQAAQPQQQGAQRVSPFPNAQGRQDNPSRAERKAEKAQRKQQQ